MKRISILLLLIYTFPAVAFSQSTVWFYRPANSPNPSDIPTIYQVGGVERRLAALRPGEFFGLRLNPGTYRFSYTRVPASGQYVDVPVGSTDTFVAVHYREISITNQQQGTAALRSSRPPSVAFEPSIVVDAPVSGGIPAATAERAPVSTEPVQPVPTAQAQNDEAVPDLEWPKAGFMISGGYSRPEELNAASIAFGGSFRWSRFVSFAAVDITHRNSGYEFETFENGQTVCRDESNGQFADFEKCIENPSKTVVAGMFDANVVFSPIMLGAGYRVGGGKGFYGSAGVSGRLRNEKNIWFLRTNVGKDIVQVHIGIAVHWP